MNAASKSLMPRNSGEPDLQSPQAPDPYRTLPHEPDAEKGVLCSIMMMPEDCLHILNERGFTEEFFYIPVHGKIFGVLSEMHSSGMPTDFPSVTSYARARGHLDACGGPSALTDIGMHVGTPANLRFYAKIVEDKFTMREVIRTGTEYASRGYETGEEPSELVEEFDAKVSAISRRGVHENDVRVTKDLVVEAMEGIQYILSNPDEILGIATGYKKFDMMCNGLQKKEMIVIAGRPSMGKAQPVSAMVQTPKGPRRMDSLRVGGLVSGLDGKPTEIIGIFPQGVKKVYRVTLSDGSETRCCAEHLWTTQTRNERRRGAEGSVKGTKEISETIHRADSSAPNHALPAHGAVEFSYSAALPMHPWLLGALIGDGKLSDSSVAFFKPEEDVQRKVIALLPEEDTSVAIPGGLRIKRGSKTAMKSRTATEIIAMGLNVKSDRKFIPTNYLFSSVSDRWEMLRGLIDTDGSVCGEAVEYSTSSERLSRDMMFLARSLGIKASIAMRETAYTYKGGKLNGLPSYRILLQWSGRDQKMFSSEKHESRFRRVSRKCHRSIVSVVEDGEDECLCIKVAALDSIYLTDDFIPTHNTSLAMNIAEYIAIDCGKPVGVFSMEMSAKELVQRMILSRARVNIQRTRNGFGQASDYDSIMRAGEEIRRAPIHINDKSGINLSYASKVMRGWVKRYGVEIAFFDYLQLLRGVKQFKGDNRQAEVAEISGGLKGFAKEFDMPVVVLAQLNRQPEGRSGATRGVPRLSDLRESGSIEQDADVVAAINLPERYAENSEEAEALAGIADLYILKQRNGPVGKVELTFMKEFTRFDNRAMVPEPH